MREDTLMQAIYAMQTREIAVKAINHTFCCGCTAAGCISEGGTKPDPRLLTGVVLMDLLLRGAATLGRVWIGGGGISGSSRSARDDLRRAMSLEMKPPVAKMWGFFFLLGKRAVDELHERTTCRPGPRRLQSDTSCKNEMGKNGRVSARNSETALTSLACVILLSVWARLCCTNSSWPVHSYVK